MKLTCCPKCGNDQIYRKGRATGFVKVTTTFTGETEIETKSWTAPIDNSEMYYEVNYKLTDTCYCDGCGKRFKYSKLIAGTDKE